MGGYIYEKLGRSGLIVAMQDFEHELPLAEYAKVYFDETLVRNLLSLFGRWKILCDIGIFSFPRIVLSSNFEKSIKNLS